MPLLSKIVRKMPRRVQHQHEDGWMDAEVGADDGAVVAAGLMASPLAATKPAARISGTVLSAYIGSLPGGYRGCLVEKICSH